MLFKLNISVKLKRVLIVLLALVGFTLLYILNPTTQAFMPKCPFRLLTGLSCPGCGFQRALHALLHGRIFEAASYNLYLVYAGPYALALLIQDYFLPQKQKEKWMKVLEHKYVVYFYIYTFMIWLVVRNILKI
jgi:4-hydroxybenzoate polyprenyltransferase